MRLLLAAAALLGAASLTWAGYLVDFGNGDRMTVDGYREEGEWVHLRRGSEDLSVPRARVRAVVDESGAHRIAPQVRRPASRSASD